MTPNQLRLDRYPARVSLDGAEVSASARIVWTAETLDVFVRESDTGALIVRHAASYTVTGPLEQVTVERRGRQRQTGAVAIPTSAGVVEVSEQLSCGCGDPVKAMRLTDLAALTEVAA